MNSNRKIAYVGFAFLHHKNTRAGYNRIKHYIHYDYVFDCQKYFDVYFKDYKNQILVFLMKVSSKLFRAKIFPWYIIKIWWKGLFRDDIVFHFIYAESLYLPFPKYTGKNKVVCTVHQPLNILKEWGQIDKLKEVDSIILVGNSEIEKIKEITGRDNVIYIPHGISTDFYHPIVSVKKEHMVLTVGDWLRDFTFANKVYKRLLETDMDLRIVVVSREKNREYLDNHPRLSFLSGISDEELRDLYLKSSILFLPLIRYTANNSLLEASACGCNIVISSDFPDNSYIPSEYLHLVSMDVDKVTDIIKNSYSSDYNEKLAKYIEDNFSWNVIGKRTEEYLRSL